MTDQLQDHLDSEFEETEAFVVDDDPKANWAMRKLRRYDSEVCRISAAAEHERQLLRQSIEPALAEVDAWEDQAKKTALGKVGFFRGLLFSYFDGILKRDPDLKTYKLPQGTLEKRRNPPRLAILDEPALVKWLEALPADDPQRLALKPAVVLKTRLLFSNKVELDDKQFGLVTRDGELIPGVVQVVGEEKFDVKLEADEDVE